MSSLRIPRLGLEPEQHERHHHKEHRTNKDDGDPLNKLPGQMMNLAGAAVIGSATMGILGAMNK